MNNRLQRGKNIKITQTIKETENTHFFILYPYGNPITVNHYRDVLPRRQVLSLRRDGCHIDRLL